MCKMVYLGTNISLTANLSVGNIAARFFCRTEFIPTLSRSPELAPWNPGSQMPSGAAAPAGLAYQSDREHAYRRAFSCTSAGKTTHRPGQLRAARDSRTRRNPSPYCLGRGHGASAGLQHALPLSVPDGWDGERIEKANDRRATVRPHVRLRLPGVSAPGRPQERSR